MIYEIVQCSFQHGDMAEKDFSVHSPVTKQHQTKSFGTNIDTSPISMITIFWLERLKLDIIIVENRVKTRRKKCNKIMAVDKMSRGAWKLLSKFLSNLKDWVSNGTD